VAVGVFELRALPGFALQAPIVGIFVGGHSISKSPCAAGAGLK
jgi:hypothetical protein